MVSAPESIDLLISASAIAIQALPFSAAQLLKISPLHDATASFDINTSCLSFVTALQVAASLLNTATYKRIAIVSSEIPSRGLDWSDEESSLIFGDGAACVIVERGDGNSGICSFLLETYPTSSEFCEVRIGGYRRNPRAGLDDSDFLFQMKGKQLIRQVSPLIRDFYLRLLAASGFTHEDISAVIPHQASRIGLTLMQKKMNIAQEKVIDIYRHRGNQVAASIPSVLHEASITGRLCPGKPVVLFGTAAGLSLGGMVLLP